MSRILDEAVAPFMTEAMRGARVRGRNRHAVQPYEGAFVRWVPYAPGKPGMALVRLDDGAVIPLTDVEGVGDG